MELSNERQTLTITEASKAVGVSRNKAYEAARRGEIPTIKIGKRILVPVAASRGCFRRACDYPDRSIISSVDA